MHASAAMGLSGRLLFESSNHGLCYRIRAVAGIGSACGLAGRKPDPGPPGVGSRCTTYMHTSPGCTPRLQWGSVVACCLTAATAGFVRGHARPPGLAPPGTTNNRQAHRDTHHRCTRMYKRSNFPPVTCVLCPGQVPPPQSSNYELDRPG
jgi:hypothetical protein